MLLSRGMKKISIALLSAFFSISFMATQAAPRTDGPPGAEYGEAEWANGELQLGAQFGAMFGKGSGSDHSLAAGVDVDYRPYDLFGLRASYLFSFENHKGQLLFLSPLVHGQFANLRPYVSFGPGLARMKYPDNETRIRFAVAGTVGGDVMLTDMFGIGMLYQGALVFAGPELHHVGARLVLHFGEQGL